MIKNECKHEWEKHTNFKQNLGASIYLCKKCNTIIPAPEVFQLETLLELRGFQKYIAIIAIAISFLVLLVAFFKP
ncbi:MAG: hypothetical protein A3D52_01930 [Candidatus Taylorbacteria bacterium RIFCSPHIGHO2_02_FULL_44_36]|uniref:Uncharacterized protein n=1 Tax=Candidatus Taylorbacteria bacterium RIFCSPLOWO2_12_FULL_44_15c TaxID=1802333 RepID=A0A1G2P4T8_9BACT|nr:MAG: hypothetical protein A3D52_01930 [Candidatus Taylorbacteria bacterium RIFCSPHIGHO2_02_FULL_44_36]OHA37930.1 MAG: hypothetical protein A3I97_02705 [Candidatus Taylorbacteria bacterium RIFCSPLOWO2_02_FULL_44_35]OHA43348.1 MAG: hypothetical protein A3G03_03215 [Candidatus Taylorbacteria bacterium RIFCSPLOWO2_12_FULL_44_15c]